MGFSPGKNTGVDFHALLQGIFLTWDRIRIFYVSCTALAGASLTRVPPGMPINGT